MRAAASGLWATGSPPSCVQSKSHARSDSDRLKSAAVMGGAGNEPHMGESGQTDRGSGAVGSTGEVCVPPSGARS